MFATWGTFLLYPLLSECANYLLNPQLRRPLTHSYPVFYKLLLVHIVAIFKRQNKKIFNITKVVQPASPGAHFGRFGRKRTPNFADSSCIQVLSFFVIFHSTSKVKEPKKMFYHRSWGSLWETGPQKAYFLTIPTTSADTHQLELCLLHIAPGEHRSNVQKIE